MNDDLISRTALKEALKSNCKPEICHDFGTNWCEACCPHNDFEDLIDEAPTVEINKWLDPDIDLELALENIRRIVYEQRFNKPQCFERENTKESSGC